MESFSTLGPYYYCMAKENHAQPLIADQVGWRTSLEELSTGSVRFCLLFCLLFVLGCPRTEPKGDRGTQKHKEWKWNPWMHEQHKITMNEGGFPNERSKHIAWQHLSRSISKNTCGKWKQNEMQLIIHQLVGGWSMIFIDLCAETHWLHGAFI